MRSRSAARIPGSTAKVSSADPTNSAAPSAGTVACGAAMPTADRSSMTSSYSRARPATAIHSGRLCRRPIARSSRASTPRSVHRAMRSRTPVAKPAVVKAGRSEAGHDPLLSSALPHNNSRTMLSCSAAVMRRGGGFP
ncbi:Uncharacterised protein [Mycobacteroides abscessus subsp. abscessus]|nr:Uncharacterised protein [Mycobacteroides abscessus subsp. abscessus]